MTQAPSANSANPDSGKEANLEGLEFDGDTVLCRVCGDKASGFHYGVHACEGCKGFFRRSIQQKIQYRPCLKNQQCNITRVNRNRCQYCRLKKCIAVGMSRDAVRFGRVPKREKEQIANRIQKANAQNQSFRLDYLLDSDSEVIAQIVEAHMNVCPFTTAKFNMLREKACNNAEYVNCPAHMACPLNPSPENCDGSNWWEEFSGCITPIIESVVSFAKLIPGFKIFSQEDQVTLLKAGTFEVLLVHLSRFFDVKSNTMLFTNGKMYKRVAMTVTNSAGFLLDSMFDFAERMNALDLLDEEVALFSALVIMASDRPGLRNVEHVEKVQRKIQAGLQTMLKVNHPDSASIFAMLLTKVPDLRTLNALHSEKLEGMTVRQSAGKEGIVSADKGLMDVSAIASFFPNGMVLPPPPGVPCGQAAMLNPLAYTPEAAAALASSQDGAPIVPHQVTMETKRRELVLQTSIGAFHRGPAHALGGVKTEPTDSPPAPSSEDSNNPEQHLVKQTAMDTAGYPTPAHTPGSQSALTSRSCSPDSLELDIMSQESKSSSDGMPTLSVPQPHHDAAEAWADYGRSQAEAGLDKKRHINDDSSIDFDLKAQKMMSEEGMRSYRSNSVGGSFKFGIRPRSDSLGNAWSGDGHRSRSNSLSTKFERLVKIRSSRANTGNGDGELRSSRSGSFSSAYDSSDLRYRSDSISSSASLESGDSGYRTNPSTPRTSVFEMRSQYSSPELQARLEAPVSKAPTIAPREIEIGNIPEENEDPEAERNRQAMKHMFAAQAAGSAAQISGNWLPKPGQFPMPFDPAKKGDMFQGHGPMGAPIPRVEITDTSEGSGRKDLFVFGGGSDKGSMGSHRHSMPNIWNVQMENTERDSHIEMLRSQHRSESCGGQNMYQSIARKVAREMSAQGLLADRDKRAEAQMDTGTDKDGTVVGGKSTGPWPSPDPTTLGSSLSVNPGSGPGHEEKKPEAGKLPPSTLPSTATYPGGMVPHPAYYPMPYPLMHPAHLYQYAAMQQQYQAMQQQMQARAQTDGSTSFPSPLPSQLPPRTSPSRVEPNHGDKSSPGILSRHSPPQMPTTADNPPPPAGITDPPTSSQPDNSHHMQVPTSHEEPQ